MTTTNNNRQPFPTDVEGPECPNCGAEGTIQAVEWGLKVWEFQGVEDGVAVFDGHFDWTEECRDEHIACWECRTEWSMPGKVEYVS